MAISGTSSGCTYSLEGNCRNWARAFVPSDDIRRRRLRIALFSSACRSDEQRTCASHSSSGNVSTSLSSCATSRRRCDMSCQRRRHRSKSGMRGRRTGGGKLSGICGGGTKKGNRRSCHQNPPTLVPPLAADDSAPAPVAEAVRSTFEDIDARPSRRVALANRACMRPQDDIPCPPSVDSYQVHGPFAFSLDDKGRAANSVTSVHIK